MSSTIRKLSNYRQLSLTYDSPQQKRKNFKKQFSEDAGDFKEPSWLIYNKGNDKDKREPIKIAWSNNENFSLNDEVIIKKCSKEIKRVNNSGKLIRHPSLEKDSILSSKQDICERLDIKINKNEKSEVKPNLQIYLAHNTTIDSQSLDNLDDNNSDQILQEKPQPKYLQPLLTQQNFQIKKNANKKPLDSPKAETKRPNFSRSNTIVVVPLVVEKDENNIKNDSINVVIRPMTAQSRREKFQKRTGSAFHGTKDSTINNSRPPLVRSSSAPSTKSTTEKSKFLASKRKLKTKKSNSPKNEDNKLEEAKEWKNNVQTASEIVTMVSLISPSGSENEEGSEDEKERPKSVLKRESSIVEKQIKDGDTVCKENAKNVSLRKTVKSVSFQQSSIHAVRSFSASFPARRGSMATALTLGNSKTHQEKRGTNPGSPDSDERVPKRRLVRSNTDDIKSSTWQRATSQINHSKKVAAVEKNEEIIAVDVHAKNDQTLKLEENVILITPEEKIIEKDEEKPISDAPTTPNEKQCWAMYCKMTQKGINVSYDTILRGMLTPTEYRIRRKISIADEMNLLVNAPEEAISGPKTSEDLMKSQ